MSKSHVDKKGKAHDKKEKKKIAAVEATAAPALDSVLERAASDRPALEKAIVPRQGVSAPAKPGFDGAVETIGKSLKAVGNGTVAVHCKLLDITQANLNSGLEFATRLAGAKTPLAAMRLQMTYWEERIGVLASQSQELHALSAELLAKTAEPIREHVRRSRAAKGA
ncbi:MAG: phasin family protein [Methyloceanibacter sp.]